MIEEQSLIHTECRDNHYAKTQNSARWSTMNSEQSFKFTEYGEEH